MTDAEQHLWRYLRLRQIGGFKFRRQHPVGAYILDFACIEKKLAIELDGGQHNQQYDYDNARSLWLAQQGWQIIRFWNHDVLQNVAGVLERIQAMLVSKL
jgi:very-short-patch-repair endonuclease